MSRASWAVAVVAFALGCGGRNAAFDQALKPLPLVATSGALVQVVPQTERAVVVTPEGPPRTVRIAAGARLAARVPRTDLVVVAGGTARAPTLDLVDARALTVERLALPAPFDTVTFSDDGALAVLSYSPGGASFGTLVARNLNEVAVLDVARRALVTVQLESDSLAPRAIVFGPKEADRQLVAVVLERGVALFDALHPAVAARRVGLRPASSTVEATALEAVFSADARWLFVRTNSLDDVVVLELGTERGAPPSVSINFVAGGTGLADIAAPPPTVSGAVLALYQGSRELVLLDAQGVSDRNRRVALTASLRRLGSVAMGDAVLAWDETSRIVTAWNVTDGRVGVVVLDGPPAGLSVAAARGRLFAPVTSTSGSALSVLTLGEEPNRLRLRLQSLQLSRAASTVQLDATAARLFVTVGGLATLVTLDTATLDTAEVTVDQPPVGMVSLPDGDWLALLHAGDLGDVTFVRAGATERSDARRVVDFALTDALARAEDKP